MCIYGFKQAKGRKVPKERLEEFSVIFKPPKSTEINEERQDNQYIPLKGFVCVYIYVHFSSIHRPR